MHWSALSLMLPVLALISIGTLFVHSATGGSEVPFPSSQAKVHLIRICMGMGLLLLILRCDYRRFEDWAPILYIAGIGALLGLLAVKLVQGGVVRWFQIPGLMSLQPSEPMKLLTILFVAKVLKPNLSTRRDPPTRNALAVAGLPFLLVALQPDLGTAMVWIPTILAMLWVAGTPLRKLVLGVLVVLAVLAPLAPFAMHDYQKARVVTFLRPLLPDAMTASTVQHFRPIPLFPTQRAVASSYQVEQSITAIGSGGPTGKGLYLGTINYLDALPANHNDFIFAVVGEEWGLRGTLLVLGLYLVLYLACLRFGYRTREPFGRLVVVGVTTQLAFQTVVNLAMTLGMTPVTGLPLPFLSYGGSAMLASIMGVGLILSVSTRPVRILSPDGLRAGTSSSSSRR